jgi:hypothetical protein
MVALKKTNARLIWRGAFGGALGAPVFLTGLALNEKFRIGHVLYGGALEVVALPTFLLVGAVFGAVIGGIIWASVRIIGTARLPTIIRAIFGASITLILFGIFLMLGSGANRGIPPAPMEAMINVLLFIVSFGALPGIAARPRILEDETDLSRTAIEQSLAADGAIAFFSSNPLPSARLPSPRRS